MTINRAALRIDRQVPRPGTGKKCGNSYIPANAKCTVGVSGVPVKGKTKNPRQKLETAAIAGGAITQLIATGVAAHSVGVGNFERLRKAADIASAGSAISGVGLMARGNRTKNRRLVEEGKSAIATAAVGVVLPRALSNLAKPAKPPTHGLGSNEPLSSNPLTDFLRKRSGKNTPLYTGPEPRRQIAWGSNGPEFRDNLGEHRRWTRRTGEYNRLENSYKLKSPDVDKIRKLNKIYKGPSGKSKFDSVWATGFSMDDFLDTL